MRGSDGHLTANARCEHWTGEPGALDLAWGAARRFTLVPRLTGPDVADQLHQLITQWRVHLAMVPETDGEDTAAIIDWPSRDVDGYRVLLEHGLVPLSVLAVRRERRSPAAASEIPPGVTVRRAGPADVEVAGRLGHEEILFDSHFGACTARPDSGETMRAYLAGQLGLPEPWTWLAERDGTAVGLLTAERPEAAASWLAPLTSLSPAAYLLSMFVSPDCRAQGIGGLLTRQFNREISAAGVAGTLLHYEVLNPLSGPFWSRQGFRPLWISAQARPARKLR